MAKIDLTEEWKQYQTGVDYNTKIGYYNNTELCWRFYNNDHWYGIKTNGLPTPVFPLARSGINYFIASIMSQKVKLQYSAENIFDDMQRENINGFLEVVNGYMEIKWEKDKMDALLREALLDGANSGDFAAHVYWDSSIETGQNEKGDFHTELVDGVNVLFGNPNNRKVKGQPYIIIVGRESVSKLKDEAKRNKVPQDLIDTITSDEENAYQAGQFGKIELDNKGDDGKALYLIKYWEKDGKVYWNKSTKFCPIRSNVDQNIRCYPIAFGNWESIKNSYHGMAVMRGLIPNNILVNQLFAMVAYWCRMSAFGKVIYDSTKIQKWTNQIGEALKANGDVNNAVVQIQGGNFNGAVLSVIDMAVKYTKDFMGMFDAVMGNVKPENTSAIIAVIKQAGIPLENIQANLYQFVEDIGLIWGEFMLKKYRNRQVNYKQNGIMQAGNINTKNYQDLMLNINVDVGQSTYWSEIASMQTLDNLLNNGVITPVEYFERQPSGVIPNKQGLIKNAKLKEQQENIFASLQELPPEMQNEVVQAIQQILPEIIGGITGEGQPEQSPIEQEIPQQVAI